MVDRKQDAEFRKLTLARLQEISVWSRYAPCPVYSPLTLDLLSKGFAFYWPSFKDFLQILCRDYTQWHWIWFITCVHSSANNNIVNLAKCLRYSAVVAWSLMVLVLPITETLFTCTVVLIVGKNWVQHKCSTYPQPVVSSVQFCIVGYEMLVRVIEFFKILSVKMSPWLVCTDRDGRLLPESAGFPPAIPQWTQVHPHHAEFGQACDAAGDQGLPYRYTHARTWQGCVKHQLYVCTTLIDLQCTANKHCTAHRY